MDVGSACQPQGLLIPVGSRSEYEIDHISRLSLDGFVSYSPGGRAYFMCGADTVFTQTYGPPVRRDDDANAIAVGLCLAGRAQ